MKKLRLFYLIMAVIYLIIIVMDLRAGNSDPLSTTLLFLAGALMCLTAFTAGYMGFVKEGHHINL